MDIRSLYDSHCRRYLRVSEHQLNWADETREARADFPDFCPCDSASDCVGVVVFIGLISNEVDCLPDFFLLTSSGDVHPVPFQMLRETFLDLSMVISD